jgi:hypothetical protein
VNASAVDVFRANMPMNVSNRSSSNDMPAVRVPVYMSTLQSAQASLTSLKSYNLICAIDRPSYFFASSPS